FIYSRPVVSGATIGTWKHDPVDAASLDRFSAWKNVQWDEPLAYRPDLPTVAATDADLQHWQNEEVTATQAGDPQHARNCRARAEQAARQLWRLRALPPDRFPLPMTLARLG